MNLVSSGTDIESVRGQGHDGGGAHDFLSSSFVFINILALFPRMRSLGVEKSRSPGVEKSRKASDTSLLNFLTPRLLDLLPSSFVFINIPALFRRFW